MDDDAQITSVIGGAKRSGRWRVPASTRTLTIFGRCLIDLRQAETTADELSFSCISAFAGVTFIVPEGAEVRPSGMAILGSARSLVPVSDTPAHLPPISIDAITVMGRLRIRTTDEEPEEELRDSWRERRRVRKESKRAEKAAAASAASPTAVGSVQPDESVGAPRGDQPGPTHRAEPERILVDEDDLRRSERPLLDEGERRDLAPAQHHDEARELVDLKPAVRRPSILAPSPSTEPDDSTADAPDLFAAPRMASTTVDPEPIGSIDDHPTAFASDEPTAVASDGPSAFVNDDHSPLEDLRVPDSADGLDDRAEDSSTIQ